MTVQKHDLLALRKKARSIKGVKIVTTTDISNTLDQLITVPRAREPILVHDTYEEIPQRFINCLAQSSYMRPHMHVVPNHWELMSWLAGEIIILLFDDDGTVNNKIIMNENDAKVVEIPPFCYHTFFVREKGAYLEIRNCKFQPSADRLYAAWAPPEDSPSATSYHQRFFSAEVGSILTV